MGKEVKENLGRVVLASVAGSGGFVSGFIGIAGPQNEVLWLYCTHMLEYIYICIFWRSTEPHVGINVS